MSENTPNANQQPKNDKDSGDLLDELREMGQQLETAFRAAIQSDRAKQLQKDLAGGVREITEQLKTAAKSVQSDTRFQQAEERGRQAVAQARESKVVQDIQETLVSGIAHLNDQLRKVVDRIQSEANAPSSGPVSQDVPVDDQSAATGETTRLKDD
jgi:heparin binding hemagglutinin HbhA